MGYCTTGEVLSTTVEIILYYLTVTSLIVRLMIYNSRNYSILLNVVLGTPFGLIYNSRNYSILLNVLMQNLKYKYLQQ